MLDGTSQPVTTNSLNHHRRGVSVKKMREIQKFMVTRQLATSTFNAALQKFLVKRRGAGISDYSMIHLYNSLYPMSVELNNPSLDVLTSRDVREYVERLWLRYAPGTMRPLIGDLKQFFGWCKKKGYTAKNLGNRLAKPRPRRNSFKAAYETDVTAVINHLAAALSHRIYRDLFGNLVYDPAEAWCEADVLAMRDMFVVVFLYETGGRASELAKLGAKTMDRVCQSNKAAYSVTSTGKTNDRDLRFTNNVADLWRVWSAVRPHQSEYAVYGLRPTHPPLPLTSNGLSQILVRRCDETKVTRFRCHALRHAKVRRARQLVGLEVASLLIDHSSVEMTRNYSNVDGDELAEAVVKTGLQHKLWGQKGEKVV